MDCSDSFLVIACDQLLPYKFSNNTSDYNLFWSTENTLSFRHGWSEDRHVKTLEAFKNLSKNEEHSLTADPGFTKSTELNIVLSDKSPAIDAGVTLDKVKKDFFGNMRPMGKGYDIGPYEFNNTK